MQLYALNNEQKLIFADHAAKQTDYICLECQGVVRARGGMHRQNHYYHLTPNASCHLSAKSMLHIQTQAHFKKILPSNECVLERHFSEINRIADVVWFPQKLIFEIQCSFISAEEVQNRNRDYASVGFQVIWILHDHRFNQRRITAVESFLRRSPVYFTNIDANGKGFVYDQFDHFEKGYRVHKLQEVPIDFCMPYRLLSEVPAKSMTKRPLFVQQRIETWPVCFSGDLINTCLLNTGSSEYMEEILQIEAMFQAKQEKLTLWDHCKQIALHYFVRPYHLIFQILLEKACK